MTWFRLYTSVAHDPKVQLLPAIDFKAWINLLCLASENGGRLPPIEQIAWVLRMSKNEAQGTLDRLIDAGLFEKKRDGIIPHNWKGRQYNSDSSRERVERYRDKLRNAGETVTGYTKFRKFVLERDGHQCVYCGGDTTLVIDHLVGIGNGGDSQPDNLVTACKSCNSRKRDRSPEEAGMTFIHAESVTQYKAVLSRLQSRPVTVTVTPSEQRQNRVEKKQSKKAKSAGADSPAQPGRNLFREVFSRFPRRDFNHRFEAALASVGEALMRRRLEEWRDKPGCSPTSYAEMLDVVVSGWRNDNGNGKFKSRAERDAANLRAIGEAFDFGGDTHEGIRRLGTGDPDS